MKYQKKGRAKLFRAVFLSLLLFIGVVGGALIYHPDSTLPRGWNPTTQLAITDDVTPLTSWKLRQVAGSQASCTAVLADYAQISQLPRFQADNSNCNIEAPVLLNRMGEASMSGVRTDCATAIRLAMWEYHVVQPAAQRQLGTSVVAIKDIGSYNCRMMRTSSGTTSRWSSHATASAIDITGFQFADGQSVSLINDWNDSDDVAAFLRAVRDGACDWFPLMLSPDYNALHADHFHLQATGWRLCR